MPLQKSFYSPQEWLRGEGVAAGTQLSNAYEQVVWVYRAINVLAEQVANVPFVFSAGERGNENLITSGPLLDFYARPHPLVRKSNEDSQASLFFEQSVAGPGRGSSSASGPLPSGGFPDGFRSIFSGGWEELAQREHFELPPAK